MYTLDDLLQQAWNEYDRFPSNQYVVRPSVPILYFGDSQRYLNSPLKVVTVGLNPSREEFPAGNNFTRFPAAQQVHNAAAHTSQERATILRMALDQYFAANPYRRWFDSAFEAFLEGMDTSFYDYRTNTALHTDLCSPLATSPTWSGLDSYTQRNLFQSGSRLWHRLMEVLQPDIMLVSVRRSLLDSISFRSLTPWKNLVRFPYTKDGMPRAKPYLVDARWKQISDSKRSLIVFGEASQMPFGTLSHQQRTEAGGVVMEEIRASGRLA